MTKVHNFLHNGVNDVKNLNTCVLDFFCHVCCVIWVHDSFCDFSFLDWSRFCFWAL